MSGPTKWLVYFLGFLALLAFGLWIFVKTQVGAVNTPITGGDTSEEVLDQKLKVPEGFSVGVYARVNNARVVRFSPGGHLLVANPSKDQVTILSPDADGNGQADSQRVLMSDLNGPNGLDFYEDWLYIAETDAIGRVKFDHQSGTLAGEYERIVTGLPAGGNHWKKTLRFGPDGLMYVSMGSSCNVCIEADERRAAMVRYQPDGSGEEIFARGLRNSAGFDWSPVDGQIYATDNGRDLLGDDFPPCELNQVVEGAHYGWPFANGNKIPDPDFGAGNESVISASVPPLFDFRAHNAPLGIEFVRANNFPASYQGAAIVALHGSWNRSEKDGYKVVSLHWDAQGNVIARDFLSGFLENDKVIGRPAEVTQGPDGAFYIADDFANVVYRVAYGETQQVSIEQSVVQFNAVETLAGIPDADLLEMTVEGEQLFNQFQCISCHADNGRALKKLENLGEKYDLVTLAAYLRRPTAPMPIFPFTDAQRTVVAAYLIQRYPGGKDT